MRLVLAMAMVLASSTAFASSITTLGGTASSRGSIIEKRCTQCVAAMPKPGSVGYKVPELAPGTQKTEIIELNGEQKLARTEAWFGGSPVVYISKVPGWMVQDSAVAEAPSMLGGPAESAVGSRDGVDIDSTTGAVESMAIADPATAETSAALKPLDVASFGLRID